MTGSTGFQPVDLKPVDPLLFHINITKANNLITKWCLIAESIARQCKWRPAGKCLADCKGMAVCNLDGLTLVNAQGQPVTHNPQGGPN